MRWRIRTLLVVVAWSGLFAAALSLDRPGEMWGWLGPAIAIFFLMIPTVVIVGGVLLANLHDLASGSNRPPAWVAGMKTASNLRRESLPNGPSSPDDRPTAR